MARFTFSATSTKVGVCSVCGNSSTLWGVLQCDEGPQQGEGDVCKSCLPKVSLGDLGATEAFVPQRPLTLGQRRNTPHGQNTQ